MTATERSDKAAGVLLSVVMPVYNERATIDDVVGAVRAAEVDKELIIIDDGSTDGTRDRLREIAQSDGAVRLICHEKNRGKGAALRTGFAAALGEFVVVQDADLEYDPSEYVKLLRPLIDDRADVVYGSRFLGGESRRVHYFWHAIGNRFLTSVSNMFTNLNISDMETCYKVFRREIIQDIAIQEDGFGVEPEITAKIAAYRLRGAPLRICEVGISYRGRTFEEGKKINWRDGVHALWCIVKYNLLR